MILVDEKKHWVDFSRGTDLFKIEIFKLEFECGVCLIFEHLKQKFEKSFV